MTKASRVLGLCRSSFSGKWAGQVENEFSSERGWVLVIERQDQGAGSPTKWLKWVGSSTQTGWPAGSGQEAQEPRR